MNRLREYIAGRLQIIAGNAPVTIVAILTCRVAKTEDGLANNARPVDDVEQYAELELVVPEPEVPAARDRLASLARHLGLQFNERRGYLELLLGERLRNRPPARAQCRRFSSGQPKLGYFAGVWSLVQAN